MRTGYKPCPLCGGTVWDNWEVTTTWGESETRFSATCSTCQMTFTNAFAIGDYELAREMFKGIFNDRSKDRSKW